MKAKTYNCSKIDIDGEKKNCIWLIKCLGMKCTIFIYIKKNLQIMMWILEA